MDDPTPTGQETASPLPEPDILLTSEIEQPCPKCRKPTLAIVTASVDFGPGTEVKPIGGWALCTSCHAAPHPVVGRPDRG